MEKQLDLLLGNLEGGPTSYGSDSKWRMPVSNDLSRITINKFDAITNFKQSYNENLIKDCSECTEIVDRLYSSYTNRTNLNESELNNLVNKARVCGLQKISGCGSKMEKQLNILTGRLEGGPLTTGASSKWRVKTGKMDLLTPEFKNLKPMPNGDVIFSYNNLYGVKDKNDLVFIYPKYEKIEYINFKNSDYLIVTKEKKEGVIDFFGNVKLPIEYRQIQSNTLNPDLLIFRSFDRKTGVITGNFLKKEIQSNWISFEEQFTTFQKDDKYGFLDNNGDIKIEPNYDKVDFTFGDYDFRYFTLENVSFGGGGGSVEVRYVPSNNVLVVERDNKFGLVGDNLKEIVPPKYDKIGHINIVTSTCIKGLIPIWENGKMGYVDDLGNILIAPKYDAINGFGIKNWLKDELSYVNLDKKWGLFSNKSRVELTPIQYDNITYNGESLFKVEIQNKTGLLNFSGKEVLSPDNYEITGFDKKQSFLILKKEGKYGLFNKDGSLFTSCIFDEIDPYFNSNLYSRVKKDLKWGVIDRLGNQIIETKFDNLIPIANNFYQVSSGNKWGLINQSGNLVISTKYDEPFTFSNGKANVRLNGLAFRINEREEVVYNDFQNSTLSQLEVGGVNMKKQIESRFRDVFTKAASQEIVGAMLGTKSSSKDFITNQTYDIKSTVEGWLGGQMTKAQLNEFYDILKQEAAMVNFALGMMAESLKSSNNSSYSNQSSFIYGQERGRTDYYEVGKFENGIIYRKNPGRTDYYEIGKFENGIIYGQERGRTDYFEVGKFENGIVYRKNPGRTDYYEVGKFEDGIIYGQERGRTDYYQVGKSDSYQGGAAFLLIF
jgi:hypothetical protein